MKRPALAGLAVLEHHYILALVLVVTVTAKQIAVGRSSIIGCSHKVDGTMLDEGGVRRSEKRRSGHPTKVLVSVHIQ